MKLLYPVAVLCLCQTAYAADPAVYFDFIERVDRAYASPQDGNEADQDTEVSFGFGPQTTDALDVDSTDADGNWSSAAALCLSDLDGAVSRSVKPDDEISGMGWMRVQTLHGGGDPETIHAYSGSQNDHSYTMEVVGNGVSDEYRIKYSVQLSISDMDNDQLLNSEPNIEIQVGDAIFMVGWDFENEVGFVAAEFRDINGNWVEVDKDLDLNAGRYTYNATFYVFMNDISLDDTYQIEVRTQALVSEWNQGSALLRGYGNENTDVDQLQVEDWSIKFLKIQDNH